MSKGAKDALKSLIAKRAAIRRRLKLFSKFLDKFIASLADQDNNKTGKRIAELEARLSNVELLSQEFENVQLEIELLSTETDQETEEREQFENEFYDIVSDAKQILAKLFLSVSVPSSVAQPQVVASNKANIKLPTIQLPTFNGEYDKWLEYHDTFDSLIHKNSNINDMEKFHYLKASIGGEAAKVIHSLEMSATNYTIAWQLLCERFANKKLLVFNHTKCLFNLQPITKESSQQLRNLVDSISSNLRALQSLNQPTNHWDTLLIFLVSSKLDAVTEREWEQVKCSGDLPTLQELIDFLKNRADILEKIEAKQPAQINKAQANKAPTHYHTNYRTNKSFFVSNTFVCVYCKRPHRIYTCAEFLKLSVNSRIELAKKLQLCSNCLNAGHKSNDCRFGNCKKCNFKHHSLLHLERQSSNKSHNSQSTNQADNAITGAAQDASNSLALTSYNQMSSQTLLSTVVVQIKNSNNGLIQNCRAILDSGSQSNYITDELSESLCLTKEKVDISIQGIGNITSKIKYRCNTQIQSCHNSFSIPISCLVLPSICQLLPEVNVDFSSLNIPSNIKLADTEFYRPSKVDLIIGAELFWQLLCVGQISLGAGRPTLHKTKFGWIVSGPIISRSSSQLKHCNYSSCYFSTNLQNKDQDDLSKFWFIEECPTDKPVYSKEEQACESHFLSTTERASDGHFIVSIPLKRPVSDLGDSRGQAIKQFYSLERRLKNNPVLLSQYTEFLREYENMGHMTKIKHVDLSQKDAVSPSYVEYFLPHHGVLKEDSLTTKLRVVFNASASSTSGVSFNDCQMVGPTIQSELFEILIRFRQYANVASADIAKMYRMVWVEPKQRSLQQIIWRETPLDPLSVFQLNTVTYGTASASFLAIRSLNQLSIENSHTFPEASRIIATDFYVDDLLTSNDDVTQLSKHCQQISDILRQGGFELRKWISNNPKLLETFERRDNPIHILQLGSHENAKTLGVSWSSHSDSLIINISSQAHSKYSTKRMILAGIAQIYDPLGLLSASIVKAKIILQKLWLERLNWDEAVSMEIHTTWVKFRKELLELNNFQIPRHVRLMNPCQVELHSFSDSSESAYGSCLYVRSIDSTGVISVHLLCGKSKVAPLKSVSLPRLELCGALIAARLVHKIIQCVHYKFDRLFYWCDSTIVLGWINTQPNLLKTFVANRIAEIQTKTNSADWHHVRSKDNAADLLSRGISPLDLKISDLWWHGPSWLSEPQDKWPQPTVNPFTELPELKISKVTLLAQPVISISFKRFTNINRLIRAYAYCFRYLKNLKKQKSERDLGVLDVVELQIALTFLLKQVQAECFPTELERLKTQNPISPKSRILSLNPFVDEQGLIRVGGRISNSNFSFNKKHPILLPSSHYFVKLLFENEHNKLFHVGPQHLLAAIREKYWPVNGRNLAKQTYRSCVRCFKVKPTNSNNLMGNLPETRLNQSFPFNVSGVDYCGPFYMKDRPGRGCKIVKSYVALFVCFTTKALHVELVTDMTTNSFLLALKRFIARRGKPYKLYSDNGSNLVGARNEMRELFKTLHSDETMTTFSNFCASEGIEWSFIPSYSPHFGGLWEAGVKSLKTHLRKVIGYAHLTFEELSTVLTQIEGMLNSRPLSPLSSNPTDFEPITPAHFLIGRPITATPEPDITDIKENRLNRFQRMEQMRQQIWRRWSSEYIAELQTRSKWKTTSKNVKLNTLVLIKDKNLPPLKWSLGRVVQLHPGSDQIVRVVSIQTVSGIVKRAVATICALPLDSE